MLMENFILPPIGVYSTLNDLDNCLALHLILPTAPSNINNTNNNG